MARSRAGSTAAVFRREEVSVICCGRSLAAEPFGRTPMTGNYDFTTLSPEDFELLARDLLAAELGVHVESFRSGRDRGIDLRYAKIWNGGPGATVVQCKYYVRSGFSALSSTLRRTELPKIQKLRPTHYRLITSVPLSPSNKLRRTARKNNQPDESSASSLSYTRKVLRADPLVL